jgi:hypothetical protein
MPLKPPHQSQPHAQPGGQQQQFPSPSTRSWGRTAAEDERSIAAPATREAVVSFKAASAVKRGIRMDVMIPPFKSMPKVTQTVHAGT